MDEEEARGLCWIFGCAGVGSALGVQALQWWQARRVPAGREAFFLRSVLLLIPSLLWTLYCLLLTPATAHSLTLSFFTPRTLLTTTTTTATSTSSSTSLGPVPGPGAPALHSSRAHVLPHTGLLTASVLVSVSLASLSLALLPCAEPSAKRKAKVALSLVAAILAGAVPLAWALSPAVPAAHSPLDPRPWTVAFLLLLGPLSCAAGLALPSIVIAHNMKLLVYRGYAQVGAFAMAIVELFCAALWGVYGAISGDNWVSGCHILLAILMAFFVLVSWFVDHTRRNGGGTLDDLPTTFDGYEMVGPRDPFDSETILERPGSSPNLTFEDLDNEFDEWLQRDIIAGKRVA